MCKMRFPANFVNDCIAKNAETAALWLLYVLQLVLLVNISSLIQNLCMKDDRFY